MRRFLPGATSCSSCFAERSPNNLSARSTLKFHPRSAESMSDFSVVILHLPFVWTNRTSSAALLPPFRSDLRSAAVHEQFDTSDETGVVRSKKQRRLGNFLGFPHASHRDGGHNARNHFWRLPTHQRRIGWTRTHNVGTDTTVLQVRRPCSDERADGSLTRRVNAEATCTFNTCDRAIENDRAAIFQQRQGLLHSKKRSLHIDIE